MHNICPVWISAGPSSVLAYHTQVLLHSDKYFLLDGTALSNILLHNMALHKNALHNTALHTLYCLAIHYKAEQFTGVQRTVHLFTAVKCSEHQRISTSLSLGGNSNFKLGQRVSTTLTT